MKLKLEIELIPSARGKVNRNLWQTIPEVWVALGNACKNHAGNKCEICGIKPHPGAKGGLHCHEIWSYDDETHIQKLIGLIALCGMCHRVKHIIQSMVGESYPESREYIPMEYIVLHFMEVNQCDIKTYKEHRHEVIKDYNRRSEHEWDIDFGEYSDLVGLFHKKRTFSTLGSDEPGYVVNRKRKKDILQVNMMLKCGLALRYLM